MATNARLWRYYVLSNFKDERNIDLWDHSDPDISVFLDEDRRLGNGALRAVHENNSNPGVTTLELVPTIDISDYTHMFLWGKTNNVSNVTLTLESSTGNSKGYHVINSSKNINILNAWKSAKVLLSSADVSAGSFDPTSLESIYFSSNTPNQAFNFNFLVLARSVFEFETDVTEVMQGLATSLQINNTNLPIAGGAGGITINTGSGDSNFGIPCFLRGQNGFRKLLDLKTIAIQANPLLLEIEGYEYYPIMIDDLSETNMSKELEPGSNLTQFDFNISAHIYNND